MPAYNIRPPRDTDAAAIAGLLGELGYPTRADAVVPRLARIGADPRAIVLLACRGSDPVGVIAAQVYASLNHDTCSAQLTLLSVSAGERRGGCGRALVAAAADWARAQGARRLTVGTALHRADAHAFYERLGYVQSGKRYARTLDDS